MLNKLYNDRTNKGLLVHHHLAERRATCCSAACGPTNSSATSSDWVVAAGQDHACGSSGPTSSPIALSPALTALASQAAQPAEYRIARTTSGKISRRRPIGCRSLAGEIEDWRRRQSLD